MTEHPFKKTRLRKGLFLSAISFLCLFSCKEEGEVVPEFNTGSLKFEDVIIEVTSSTVAGDSVQTSNTSRNLLGKLNDQTYGLSEAEFYTQLNMSSTSLNITDEVFDSIVLYLSYDNFYGFNYSQEVQVYEVSEEMDQEKDYYSHESVETESNMLGFAPLEVDTSNRPTDTTVLRVKLDISLAQRIKDKASFSDQDEWLEFFKGIRVTTDESVIPSDAGDGAVVYFNLLNANTKMSLFYQDGSETNSIDFIVESENARFSHFKNTYSDNLNGVLGKEDLDYNYVFALSGSRTKLTFEGLADLASQGSLAINKAELIIPYEDPNVDVYFPPERNVLIMKDNSDSWILPPDFLTRGSEYFGGYLDLVNQQYTFNIASTIHDMIQDGNFDRELFFAVSGGAVTANRLRLNSGTNPNRKIYLILSYTKSG